MGVYPTQISNHLHAHVHGHGILCYLLHTFSMRRTSAVSCVYVFCVVCGVFYDGTQPRERRCVLCVLAVQCVRCVHANRSDETMRSIHMHDAWLLLRLLLLDRQNHRHMALGVCECPPHLFLGWSGCATALCTRNLNTCATSPTRSVAKRAVFKYHHHHLKMINHLSVC